MYKEFDRTLRFEEKGETIEEVFNKMFSQIRNKLSYEIKDLIIRIEPKDIEVVEAKKIVFTERFLGLFFPRKRNLYKVKAMITVRVGVIEISQIKFEEIDDTPTLLKQFLKI
ncbi:DUF4312 family protein [Thermoanaerobacter thermohydrosulfuricus]|uniref:DUF4312 family protein n=1 Tax=Thermoanaerobacter TaxID=1754 RepID=UPI000402D09D|nr:DUF4312 family protein [Thermoanaerobacter sp. A7A]HHW56131.1 DUF4312 family protein [Clostridia bacterium]